MQSFCYASPTTQLRRFVFFPVLAAELVVRCLCQGFCSDGASASYRQESADWPKAKRWKALDFYTRAKPGSAITNGFDRRAAMLRTEIEKCKRCRPVEQEGVSSSSLIAARAGVTQKNS